MKKNKYKSVPSLWSRAVQGIPPITWTRRTPLLMPRTGSLAWDSPSAFTLQKRERKSVKKVTAWSIEVNKEMQTPDFVPDNWHWPPPKHLSHPQREDILFSNASNPILDYKHSEQQGIKCKRKKNDFCFPVFVANVTETSEWRLWKIPFILHILEGNVTC